MDNLTATALSSMIHEQFVKWNEQEEVMNLLKDGLFEGCTGEDAAEKIYAKMIINSMELAANVSAKIILEILITAGVMEPVEEEKLRKNVLSVIK